MSKTAITQPIISYNQRIKASGGETHAMRAFYGCLVCAVLLGLSACAQAPKKVIKKVAAPLVFPSPPDDARFFYRRGLLKMVAQRRRLLDYLHTTDVSRYQGITKKLKLRK